MSNLLADRVMTDVNATTNYLKELFKRSGREINLAEAALLLAKEEYPELDVSAYLRKLDEMADNVRTRLTPQATPETIIAALNQFLFQELGFSGNAKYYYDPRNSFLNDVLDRKTGIPLTLSIVYMEVGRRLGLNLQGVPFPGHFVVKLELKDGQVILDPFSGGATLSEEQLKDRLHRVRGRPTRRPIDRFLVRAGKKEILVRMLRNLKAIYLHQEEFAKALAVVQRILLVLPDLAEELRDRGLLYERLECAQSALQDYKRYIELEPYAPDVREIRNRMIDIGKTSTALH